MLVPRTALYPGYSVLCLYLFEFVRIYTVLFFLARSRPRDSPISLLSSIQGAIVTESITKPTFSDRNVLRNLIIYSYSFPLIIMVVI